MFGWILLPLPFFQPFGGNERNWIFRNLEFSEKILEFREKFLEFSRKILEFREKWLGFSNFGIQLKKNVEKKAGIKQL